jgi:hypothetical protein
MIGKFAALAAVGVMIAGPALAADASVAQLGAVKGSVLVSQNGKMVPATAASLKAGDRVVASANGSAVVKFADGCTVALKSASMVTVAAKSPCASGAGLTLAQANVQQDAEKAAKAPKEPFFGSGWTTTDFVVAGIGGAGAIWAISDSSGNANPASP